MIRDDLNFFYLKFAFNILSYNKNIMVKILCSSLFKKKKIVENPDSNKSTKGPKVYWILDFCKITYTAYLYFFKSELLKVQCF